MKILYIHIKSLQKIYLKNNKYITKILLIIQYYKQFNPILLYIYF